MRKSLGTMYPGTMPLSFVCASEKMARSSSAGLKNMLLLSSLVMVRWTKATSREFALEPEGTMTLATTLWTSDKHWRVLNSTSPRSRRWPCSFAWVSFCLMNRNVPSRLYCTKSPNSYTRLLPAGRKSFIQGRSSMNKDGVFPGLLRYPRARIGPSINNSLTAPIAAGFDVSAGIVIQPTPPTILLNVPGNHPCTVMGPKAQIVASAGHIR